MNEGDADTAAVIPPQPPQPELSSYDTIIGTWSNTTSPLKTALEIATNLICLANGSQSDGGELREWDSGDEDEMDSMANSGIAMSNAPAASNGNEEAKRAIVNSKLHLQSCDVLQNLYTTISPSTNDVVASDLADLRERASIAVYNTIFGNFLSSAESANVFQNLLSCIINNSTTSNIVPYLVLSLTELLSRDDLASRVDGNLLTALITILNNTNGTDSNVRRETVTCLTTLMAMPHARDTNVIVCRGLVERLELESDMLVLHEVLNAIFEICGADDGENGETFNRSEVFNELEVGKSLKAFQTVFKRRIKEELKNSKQFEEEDIFLFKETALNLARFMKYKNV